MEDTDYRIEGMVERLLDTMHFCGLTEQQQDLILRLLDPKDFDTSYDCALLRVRQFWLNQ